MQAGLILGGRYQLAELVGEGGMGSVWRATQLAFGRDVAVKVMSPKLAESAEGVRRFQREAQAIATLNSEHVVQVFDFGVDEPTGSPFMVMELLRGSSLRQTLDQRHTLPFSEVLHMLTHVGRAMTSAHTSEQRVVHRDLKPCNIFLVQRDEMPLIKVLDFGIAKIQSARVGDVATRTGAVFGTPYYMSPEQIRGGQVDHRTDLWAMAVIAFECITGVRPFRGETLGDITMRICADPLELPSQWGNVPLGFNEWYLKGVARNRDDRFTSAKEMVESLKKVLDTHGARSDALPVGGDPAQPSPATGFRKDQQARAAGATRNTLSLVEEVAWRNETGAGAGEAPGEAAQSSHTNSPMTASAAEARRIRRALWPWAAAVLLPAAGGTAWLTVHNDPADTPTGVGAHAELPNTETVALQSQPALPPADALPTSPKLAPTIDPSAVPSSMAHESKSSPLPDMGNNALRQVAPKVNPPAGAPPPQAPVAGRPWAAKTTTPNKSPVVTRSVQSAQPAPKSVEDLLKDR